MDRTIHFLTISATIICIVEIMEAHDITAFAYQVSKLIHSAALFNRQALYFFSKQVYFQSNGEQYNFLELSILYGATSIGLFQYCFHTGGGRTSLGNTNFTFSRVKISRGGSSKIRKKQNFHIIYINIGKSGQN